MSYEHATTEMLIREITGSEVSHLPRLRDIARNPSLLYENGLSKTKAKRIEAALELGRRYVSEPDGDVARIQGPEDVAAIYGPRLRDLDHERFYVVLLDNSGRVISDHLVSQGTVNASLVHPREVFRDAIRNSASAVILVHNHPSGVRVASQEDRAITKCLVDAGRLVEIPVRDHVIICGAAYVSFSEQGWL
jgi:DNA repair protein RadC